MHFSAHKISLIDIRKRLLEKHESLGIVRDSSNEYFDSLSVEDIMQLSQKLGCTADNMQQLKQMCHTRHIKMWHDHSTIAAYGYLLVLVSVIYDPASYTTEEMRRLKGVEVDVPSVLDQTEVHILGRSSSSTQDQLMFIETRHESLKDLQEKVYKKNGDEVIDVPRFFYGDAPAAQFEAGHKQGGTYCCIGCGAKSGHFSDIATAFVPQSYLCKSAKTLSFKAKHGRKEVRTEPELVIYTYIMCIHDNIHVLYNALPYIVFPAHKYAL